MACFKGDCTTALAFEGDAEWILAGLTVIGVPDDQSYATLRHGLELDGWEGEPGMVPDGTLRMAFRCCAECAAKQAGFPVGPADGLFPTIRPNP